jgi:hypothetical protein
MAGPVAARPVILRCGGEDRISLRFRAPARTCPPRAGPDHPFLTVSPMGVPQSS